MKMEGHLTIAQAWPPLVPLENADGSPFREDEEQDGSSADWLVVRRRRHWRLPDSGKLRFLPLGSGLLAITLATVGAGWQGTLRPLDPLVAAALHGLALAPLALLCFRRARGEQAVTRMWQGVCGGSILSVSVVCAILALRTLGMLPTALITACALIVARVLLRRIVRQPLSWYELLATGCAGLGLLLLWGNAPGFWQAELVAVIGGGSITIYGLFLTRQGITQTSIRQWWPFFGGLFAALVAITLALALCFGSWASLRTLTGADVVVVGTTSLVAIAVPVVIFTLLFRHLSAVLLASLALLEPVISLVSVSAFGSLSLALSGWIGVGSLLVALVLHLRAVAGSPLVVSRLEDEEPDEQAENEEKSAFSERGDA